MDVWRDIILVILVLGAFMIGYFFMACLDKFLDKTREAIEREHQKKTQSHIMLTGDLSQSVESHTEQKQ